MSNKYEYLDDMYEDYPAIEKIQKNMDPEGSLTDHRRVVEPQRNRTAKKARELVRKLKEAQDD